MAELFLPVLSHFQNKNPWTGSSGRLRFRILPTAAEGESGDLLAAEVWEGPWAYEFSTVEDTKSFPLSEEGLQELSGWLEDWGKTVNGRPARSLEDDVARRIEPEK